MHQTPVHIKTIIMSDLNISLSQLDCISQFLLESDVERYKMSVCMLETKKIQLRDWSPSQHHIQVYIRRLKDHQWETKGTAKAFGSVLKVEVSAPKG